eukprot:4113157-Prymnesium_polylepis.1
MGEGSEQLKLTACVRMEGGRRRAPRGGRASPRTRCSRIVLEVRPEPAVTIARPVRELNLSIEKIVPCAVRQAGTQAESRARSPSSSASAPAAARTAALPPGERLESATGRRTRAPHRHCVVARRVHRGSKTRVLDTLQHSFTAIPKG